MRAWLCQKFGAYFDQQMSMFDSISSCLSIDDIACVVYLDEALEGLLAGVGGVDAVARLIRRAPAWLLPMPRIGGFTGACTGEAPVNNRL